MLEPCAKSFRSDAKARLALLACGGSGVRLAWGWGCSALLAGFFAGSALAASSESAPAPETPREYFNAGTRKLQDGKLRDAEALLETALGAQAEGLQPASLYNLGHVRFAQGVEDLKKGPAAKPTAAQGQAAAQRAGDAVRSADEALAGGELQKMVESYLQGRGARKEVKTALAQVKRAMESYGAALGKWRRSSGDFKSTAELAPADTQARENADRVDRSIAKLVDSLRQLQEAAAALGKQNKDLGEKLKQLRGRIPAPDMPPGAAGEDDEEEKEPFGPQLGQQEGPSKDGEEMSLSPEQAGWLLDGFKLDSERRLPMGEGEQTQPKDRGKPTW